MSRFTFSTPLARFIRAALRGGEKPDATMLSRLIACGAVVAVALSTSSLAQQPQPWPPGPGSPPPPAGQAAYQKQLCTRLAAQLGAVGGGRAGGQARGG